MLAASDGGFGGETPPLYKMLPLRKAVTIMPASEHVPVLQHDLVVRRVGGGYDQLHAHRAVLDAVSIVGPPN